MLTLMLPLAGCAVGPAPSASAPGEVTIALSRAPAHLDYTRDAGASIAQALLYNVYETLVKVDDEGRIQPLLAESWTVSADRTAYTFELRDGVRFSDGRPMTADDVKFSFDRLPEWTNGVAKNLSGITATEVVAPDVVRIRIAEPDNALLTTLATRPGTIYPENDVDRLTTRTNGTGPYVVESYDPGATMRLVANDDYWGGPPPLRRITLDYYTDPTAQTNALMTGGADAALGVDAPQLLPQFDDTPAFRVTTGTTNGEMVLSMNNRTAPFDDKRVRQAVIHAIDANGVRAVAAEGRGTMISSMVPPTDPWYEDRPEPYPYDPERARQLLAEAGTPHPTISFKVPNLPQYVRTGQTVQSYLEAAGFRVDMRILEFPAVWLGEVLTSHDYQLAVIIHAEPQDIRQFSNPNYYFGYQNAQADAVLAEARSGPPEDYAAGMRRYARIIADDAAAGFLYLTDWIDILSDRVTGVPTNASSESIDLTRLSRTDGGS
ncbi:ABC transporter substrate-binding protein [Prauserella cavernicola]|uniref:ABC transporter substrate-binding protein n=1 Tax=Prauserella cavernicola TaxID=2800127 RepID=A0A934V9A8_9PSEU|nr:ABC transporter substrate-binding protein [Prauserella cavernicola]MBK1789145.1 ABC transporter substrate-binding protein [Prauserella cavernicola]